MKREPSGFLVGTVGNEVIGFTIAFSNALGDDYVTKKNVGNVQVVHVKRGFRRKGIGSSLMLEVISYLKQSGCSVILAETGEGNISSNEMLMKLGFKKRGRLATYIKEK